MFNTKTLVVQEFDGCIAAKWHDIDWNKHSQNSPALSSRFHFYCSVGHKLKPLSNWVIFPPISPRNVTFSGIPNIPWPLNRLNVTYITWMPEQTGVQVATDLRGACFEILQRWIHRLNSNEIHLSRFIFIKFCFCSGNLTSHWVIQISRWITIHY